jgi:glycerol-3-phosphate dehydrogenase (NAD(P)+)
MTMKIAVLGAGAFGTAMAIAASDRHDVTLWLRDAQQAAALSQSRVNDRYLPGHAVPAQVRVSSAALGPWLSSQDLVVVATPMAALRGVLHTMQAWCAERPVAWLCKGFEHSAQQAGCLAHEVQAQVAPRLLGGALSGPSFAQEVAARQPTALVAASVHSACQEALVQAFHGPALRVYVNDDIAGVEVGGAVKNVLAIAAGLCDGLQLGLNARAALITRGLAEITRLGVALGARPDTFMGLSGLGDVVLTTTGDLSRNRRVGMALASGMTLAQAVASLGHVAEGVYSARTAVQRAQALGVEMPIAEAVVALLEGHTTPAQAVATLMGRDLRQEHTG